MLREGLGFAALSQLPASLAGAPVLRVLSMWLRT
jgi:hypothetical protein